MHMKRQQTLQSHFAARIADIFRETIHFQRTSKQHNAVMSNDIQKNLAFLRLPEYRRAYLRGVADTLWHQLYEANMGHKPLLEWILIGPDGQQFREGNHDWLKESDEYKSALAGKDSKSTHAWRAAMDKGEFKPW